MKAKELKKLGVPTGPILRLTLESIREASQAAGMNQKTIREVVRSVINKPEAYIDDETWGEVAKAMVEVEELRESYVPRETPAPWNQWGQDFEDSAIDQIKRATELPISVSAALMPDAHLGYGLPIGGVLATDNAVIPYAVGMDIACRMRMTVINLPVNALEGQQDRLRNALQRETDFGVGSGFRGKNRKEHQVMDEDWQISPVTRKHRDKAWAQLGTSGSGNHFVEFGTLELEKEDLGLQPGTYLALLSHSGSRGTGAMIAEHYSKIAQGLHPELPKELKPLSWLDLDTEAGQEYWSAMELMGRYAAANHELIHKAVVKNLDAKALAMVENHHNFAWKERHLDREVIVHRKGATPAGPGVLGIIPGSMATSGYVVRGLGNDLALNSCSHGAGRKMSRKAAKASFTWKEAKEFLASRNVELISAGLDEVPMAYKDIEEVMTAQADLVEPIAKFDPRLVKMCKG